jgi:hypothetical protein
VIASHDKDGNIKYSASSPDEEALVYASKNLVGIEFLSKDE